MLNPTLARLREFRLSRNLSLEQVANLLGVKKNTLWRWETGALNANTTLLDLALDTLEVRFKRPEIPAK